MLIQESQFEYYIYLFFCTKQIIEMTISFDEIEHGTWNGPAWCSAHVTSESYLYLVKLGEQAKRRKQQIIRYLGMTDS